MSADRLPPSHFAALGAPTCSRWGKLEIELLALAYVQALAASGDEWRRIPSRAAVFDLLSKSQRSEVHPYLTSSLDRLDQWFAMVADQLTGPDGAMAVGLRWQRPIARCPELST